MKKVFNTSSDVIHLFAQRSQKEARCSNVFFESEWNSELTYGTKIYSYGHHYLLGQFIDFNTIWINDEGYSVTTAKHIRELQWATNHLTRYYATSCDIDIVYSSIETGLKNLAVARKPELYINPIFDLWSNLSTYISEQKPKYNKEQKSKLRELKRIIKNLNDNTADFKETLKKAAINKAKKEAKVKKLRLKEDLKKFYNYEINSFYGQKEDYVRISQNGENVETSQQVRVTKEEAKLLYTMIKAGKDIKGYKIGYYTVISLNGTLKIGCHNINMQSVHEIGTKL